MKIIDRLRRRVWANAECDALPRQQRRNRIMESLESRIVFSFNPTGLEQEMLELINRMRMSPEEELDQIFLSTDSSHPDYFKTADPDVNAALTFFGVDDTELFNQFGSLSPTSPLAWNEHLADAALAHNNRMILQDMQSHQLPADPSLGLGAEPGLLARAVAAGYNWAGSVSVAENVFAYTENVFHGHAAFVIDWGDTPTGIQSPPGHRNNIMDSSYREVGISVVPDSDPGTGVGPLVVTQDFGTRGNYGDVRVLGVVFDDADGDNFYDAGEGSGGITITISNATGSYVTTTMDAGGYQAEVAPGTYTVVASGGGLSGNVTMGTIVVGADNVKVDLNLDDLPEVGAITGMVYSDANDNGSQDGGEAGLSGITVYVDMNQNGQLDLAETSTITGNGGTYTLSSVTAGSWHIRTLDTSEYRVSDPSSGFQTATVTVGGTASNVDFGVFQWVTTTGSTATVVGTDGDDIISWSAASGSSFTINGATHQLDPSVTQVTFKLRAGDDLLRLTGSHATDWATLIEQGVSLTSGGFVISANNAEEIIVDGNGGIDYAALVDTIGSDTLLALPDYTLLSGTNYQNRVNQFDVVTAYGTAGGTDYAFFHDSQGDDTFTASATVATLTGSTFAVSGYDFETVNAYATSGGSDTASLYDSSGNETLVAGPTLTYLQGANFLNRVHNFEDVTGFATGGGTDVARLYDSVAADTLMGSATSVVLGNGSFRTEASSFDQVFAYSSAGGSDTATLFGSEGNDTFFGSFPISQMQDGVSYSNQLANFETVTAHGGGGFDLATFHDGTGADTFTGNADRSSISGSGYFGEAVGFDRVSAVAKHGGVDVAFLNDSTGNDTYSSQPTYNVLSGAGFENRVTNFEHVYATASTGTDYAFFHDSTGNDTLVSYPTKTILRGAGFDNQARNFDVVNAYSSNGSDVATFFDSAGADTFTGQKALSTLVGTGFANRVHHFATVIVYAINGGSDVGHFRDSTDDDTFVGLNDRATLYSSSYVLSSMGFSEVTATSSQGGTDTVSTNSLDYAFSQLGNWL